MIQKPGPLPASDVPLVETPSGRAKTDWYQFFFLLLDRVNKLIAYTGTASTVAALPSAATAGAGARAFVTDASATTFHSTLAAGGANKVPVVSDGTNWLIG